MTRLVSVVIPAYNAAATISSTMESALAQTYTNLEVIVIDDGSQDSTVEVVAAIAQQDHRVRVFSYANAGPAIARNRGLDQATGEFIAFLDADDIWKPEKINDQIAALDSYPNAGLAYSWIDWIDERDQFLRPGSHIKANGYVLKKLLLRNFIDNGSNVLVRREVIDHVGQFDADFPPSEDWDMWLRIASNYEFVCVPQVQILYRVLKTSLSANVLALSKANLKVLNRCLLAHPDLATTVGRQAYADKYRYFTFKAIEGLPCRQNGWLALQFFVKAVQLEPRWWLKRSKLIFLVLLKATLCTVSPTATASVFG